MAFADYGGGSRLELSCLLAFPLLVKRDFWILDMYDVDDDYAAWGCRVY